MRDLRHGFRIVERRQSVERSETLSVKEVLMFPSKKPIKRVQINRVLESAVVLSWNDLVKGLHRVIIHVEYGIAPEPSLQYLKIWLSRTPGMWDLICEYWISPGPSLIPAAGLTFSNGYYSSDLEQILEQTIQHRDGFSDPLCGKSGVNLIRVPAPTEDDTLNARTCISEAYGRLGLVYASTPDRLA
jgi:hypothetical protein